MIAITCVSGFDPVIILITRLVHNGPMRWFDTAPDARHFDSHTGTGQTLVGYIGTRSLRILVSFQVSPLAPRSLDQPLFCRFSTHLRRFFYGQPRERNNLLTIPTSPRPVSDAVTPQYPINLPALERSNQYPNLPIVLVAFPPYDNCSHPVRPQ